ncbi:MAG: hypothetical protein ACETWM_21715 [Candidatus Lokiarchaeia archaeon]
MNAHYSGAEEKVSSSYSVDYDKLYEIFNRKHDKIGYTHSKMYTGLYNDKGVKFIETTTKMNFKVLFFPYSYRKKEYAAISEEGIEFYEIEEDKNGKIVNFKGKRKEGQLVVDMLAKNRTKSISVPLRDFDITTFDTYVERGDFLKVNNEERLRIFDPLASLVKEFYRVVLKKEQVEFNGELYDVFVVRTKIGKEESTSWILENGRLLKDIGKSYSFELAEGGEQDRDEIRGKHASP